MMFVRLVLLSISSHRKLDEETNRFYDICTNLLAIYSVCGCFIVFVCLYLWSLYLDVYLIVSVPEFSVIYF